MRDSESIVSIHLTLRTASIIFSHPAIERDPRLVRSLLYYSHQELKRSQRVFETSLESIADEDIFFQFYSTIEGALLLYVPSRPEMSSFASSSLTQLHSHTHKRIVHEASTVALPYCKYVFAALSEDGTLPEDVAFLILMCISGFEYE